MFSDRGIGRRLSCPRTRLH